MTRKDYIQLAKDIAIDLKQPPEKQANAIMDSLCAALKRDKPNFDKQRFIEACHAE